MTVTRDELLANYPRLFHMATGEAWPAIREHGLLPTARIVSTSDLPAAQRHALLNRPRPHSTAITHPVLGSVTIRDQAPLRERHLAPALTDMDAARWLDLLNERVFFWLHPDRLRGMLTARRFREQCHDVLVLDTESLLAKHEGSIELSPINSGSTLYPNAPRRGSDTFLPLARYPFAERRRRYPVSAAVVELTVIGGVPDLAAHVSCVERYRGGEALGPAEDASPFSG